MIRAGFLNMKEICIMSNEEKDLETTAAETVTEETPEVEVAQEPEVEVAEAAQEPAQQDASAQPKKQGRRGGRGRQVDPAVWEKLQAAMEDGEILSVKINDAVKAGVISYVDGVRGFIPASLLSIAYVENLEEWVGKTIDVKVITVEPEEKRLVLSGKAVEKEREAAETASKMEALAIGDTYEGVVERLAPFGVFVRFNGSLSGLVHISQMANRRVETPDEICKVGDTVNVRVIGKDDGKIRLSMKASSGDSDSYTPAPRNRSRNAAEYEYKDEGQAATGLGDLLKGIKLD